MSDSQKEGLPSQPRVQRPDTFTLTPELRQYVERGRKWHPSLPSTTKFDQEEHPVYDESLQIPAPNDKEGILRFIGLTDEWITWVVQMYEATYTSDPMDAYQERSRKNDDGTVEEYFEFNLNERLLKIYFCRDTSDVGDPYDETNELEAYICDALSQGLRPEHAIFCAIHREEDELFNDDIFKDHWYATSFQEHVDVWVGNGSFILTKLWVQKMGIKNKFELDKRDTWAAQ